MAVNTNALKNRAGRTLSGFSTGQRAVVVIAFIALLAGGVLFTQWANKPEMVPLYSNINSADAAAITTKLQSAKVPYELADGGGTILVPQAKVYQTRLDMAAANLPSGGQQGYNLLDKKGITTSDFMEHVNYQRAVEGELSKTIGAIEQVEAASVHLVLPKADVFASDSQKASASVLVKTVAGKPLQNSQVQAITNLVASSVQGLDAGNVTVADDKGRILAAPGQAPSENEDQQNQATRSFEDGLNTKIQSMLTRIVGDGNAYVQARAELNFDKSKITDEQWNADNRQPAVRSQQTNTEAYTNGANGTGDTGCLGTNTPINGVCVPGNATQGGQGNAGAYVNQQQTADYNPDRRLTQTEAATGAPRRISVAVVLNSNAANVDTAEVTNLVTQAAGLQAARGDAVVVSRMPFDTNAQTQADKELKAAEKQQQTEQIINVAKSGATLLIVIAVLAMMFLATKKRAATYSATPISLAELDAAMPALGSMESYEALSPASTPIELEQPSPEAIEREKVDREITNLIEKQPDEVAQLLRSWLADRRG